MGTDITTTTTLCATCGEPVEPELAIVGIPRARSLCGACTAKRTAENEAEEEADHDYIEYQKMKAHERMVEEQETK